MNFFYKLTLWQTVGRLWREKHAERQQRRWQKVQHCCNCDIYINTFIYRASAMAAERKLSAGALAVRDVMCGVFGMEAGVSRDAAIKAELVLRREVLVSGRVVAAVDHHERMVQEALTIAEELQARNPAVRIDSTRV